MNLDPGRDVLDNFPRVREARPNCTEITSRNEKIARAQANSYARTLTDERHCNESRAPSRTEAPQSTPQIFNPELCCHVVVSMIRLTSALSRGRHARRPLSERPTAAAHVSRRLAPRSAGIHFNNSLNAFTESNPAGLQLRRGASNDVLRLAVS